MLRRSPRTQLTLFDVEPRALALTADGVEPLPEMPEADPEPVPPDRGW